jgi:rhamnulokinase
MQGNSKFVAFDMGAESGRAVLGSFNNDKLTLEEIHRYPNTPVRVFDSLHWDVLQMFQEMKKSLEICVQKYGPKLDGIGFDTWGVDYALIGRDDSILGYPYHYRDKRTDGMMEEAFRIVPKDEIFKITGIQFMKLNTLFQLLAMSLAKSPILEATDKLLMMPDLFNFLFTGKKVSEFTIATTTQFYDPIKKGWSKDLFERLGLPFHILPEIVPPGKVLAPLYPSLRDEVGLGDVPVIAPACHDTGCAVAAVPAKDEKWAYISSGTWSLMGVEIPEPIISDLSLKYNFTNEGGVNNSIRFLKNIMGLWLIQQCKSTWEADGQNYSYSDLVKMAESAKPLVSFIEPNYEPFLSHGNMPQRIIEFCKNTGQKVPETKGAILRCALESLALKYRWVLEKLEEMLGKKINTIHIVGGGCQNQLLCKLAADATQRQVLAGPVEATAIGNIIMQAIARGYIKSIEEARELIGRSFEVKVYDPGFGLEWDSAYDRYLDIMEKTVGL